MWKPLSHSMTRNEVGRPLSKQAGLHGTVGEPRGGQAGVTGLLGTDKLGGPRGMLYGRLRRAWRSGVRDSLGCVDLPAGQSEGPVRQEARHGDSAAEAGVTHRIKYSVYFKATQSETQKTCFLSSSFQLLPLLRSAPATRLLSLPAEARPLYLLLCSP